MIGRMGREKQRRLNKMKNLLIDYDDIEYLYNKFKDVDGSTIIRLKEMQPNRDTLRIIKEQETLNTTNRKGS